jgi:single-strand DNA-binding protein
VNQLFNFAFLILKLIMSGTLNKVMLIGHLGDEIKMHYFEGGGCIGRFPLATNETYTSKQTNERITNTEWHNIVVRNKAAEICEKYLSKGDKVYIEGRLKTRKWTDDKGNERYSTEIQCNDFTFLSTKKEPGNNPQSAPVAEKPVANAQVKPIEEADDDLPF